MYLRLHALEARPSDSTIHGWKDSLPQFLHRYHHVSSILRRGDTMQEHKSEDSTARPTRYYTNFAPTRQLDMLPYMKLVRCVVMMGPGKRPQMTIPDPMDRFPARAIHTAAKGHSAPNGYTARMADSETKVWESSLPKHPLPDRDSLSADTRASRQRGSTSLYISTKPHIHPTLPSYEPRQLSSPRTKRPTIKQLVCDL